MRPEAQQFAHNAVLQKGGSSFTLHELSFFLCRKCLPVHGFEDMSPRVGQQD